MSDLLRPARGLRRWAGWLDRAGVAALVAAAGVVLGTQFLSPNKRVISVLTAVALFGLAWRVDMATALGLLVLVLPFPRFTTFGNTNLVFVLLLLVIWLLRVTLGQSRVPRRTPIDVPLVALFVCYVVSFYNVEPALVGLNLQVFALLVGCWLMFYLVASNLHTQRDFERVFAFQAVSIFSVCLVALYEVTHPGTNLAAVLASGLGAGTTEKALVGGRAGSVFLDYELLCEYCALNLLFVAFLLVRARSLLPRLAYGGLMVFLFFVLFTTVTRGGLVALAAGTIYLLWLVRRRLSLVSLTVTVAVVIATAFAMNAVVSSSTLAGNLFERLFSSEVKGLMPDTRSTVWPAAWQRIFDHPLIGHGPRWEAFTGARYYHLPHSLYLYVAVNVGFIGLAVMLWLLGTLFRMTRPVTDDLRNGDYVASYLLVARAQMLVFLVDQVKIEFLRNGHYQFQVWLMFGLMAAASLTTRARRAAGART